MIRNILTRQLVLNWLTRLFFFGSLSALLPTLPLYLVDLGGNESQVGIVMSAFAVGVFVFRPLVGKQIDSVGRKIVLIVGVLIFIVSPLFYIFIKSIPLLIPVRVFHGLGLAAFGTASITLITDAAPLKQRGEVISHTGVINTLAFAGGPILGTFIREQWGDTVLFAAVSIMSFSCFLISLFLREVRQHETTDPKPSYFQAVWKRRIIVATAMVLLAALTHGGVMIFLPIFLKGRIDVNIGLFFTIYGTAALLIRLITGRVSDRVGRGPVILFSLLSFATGVYFLSQVNNFGQMFLAAVFYGIGFGSYQPTLATLVADNTSERTRGQIFSFYYGGFDLGISIAGIFLGAYAEMYGLQNMIFLCGGIILSALLIFVTLIERDLTTSLRCAFSIQKGCKTCYIVDDYMEVPPREAEEYFRDVSKS